MARIELDLDIDGNGSIKIDGKEMGDLVEQISIVSEADVGTSIIFKFVRTAIQFVGDVEIDVT